MCIFHDYSETASILIDRHADHCAWTPAFIITAQCLTLIFTLMMYSTDQRTGQWMQEIYNNRATHREVCNNKNRLESNYLSMWSTTTEYVKEIKLRRARHLALTRKRQVVRKPAALKDKRQRDHNDCIKYDLAKCCGTVNWRTDWKHSLSSGHTSVTSADDVNSDSAAVNSHIVL